MRSNYTQLLLIVAAAFALPCVANAQSSYLPLPRTSAPVYRPVSTGAAQMQASPSDRPASTQVNAQPSAPCNCASGGSHAGTMSTTAAPYASIMPETYGSTVYSDSLSGYAGSAGWGNGGRWYGGVNVLWLDKSDDDYACYSAFDTAENVSILDTDDVQMDWTGGVELTLGKYFGCGTWAVEANYWTIDPDSQTATVYDPNAVGAAPNLVSAFDFSGLNYDDGLGGGASSIDNWFNSARMHQLQHDWEMHNFEINVVHNTCTGCFGCGKCCKGGKCGAGVGLGSYAGLGGIAGRGAGCYEVSTVFGFRLFKFDEGLLFCSDENDTSLDKGVDEVWYDIDVENLLLGCQFGARGSYYCTCNTALNLSTNFGIFANKIDQKQWIGGGNGAAVVGAGPNAGRAYEVYTQTTDLAFLGELDFGVSHQFGCHWRGTAGYRVMAITGIATAGGQIPYDFRDIDGARDINANDCMVLHGGYLGLECNY